MGLLKKLKKGLKKVIRIGAPIAAGMIPGIGPFASQLISGAMSGGGGGSRRPASVNPYIADAERRGLSMAGFYPSSRSRSRRRRVYIRMPDGRRFRVAM